VSFCRLPTDRSPSPARRREATVGLHHLSPAFICLSTLHCRGFQVLAEVVDLVSSVTLRRNNVMQKTRCDLCERLVTKRSPWGSCRIVRTGDLPVAGVLPCSHVYHAECLERTTPKGQKHDPPCPVCDKLAGKATEQWSICRLKNGFPRLRSLGEGPSRVWSCAYAGDCVAGAVQMPRSNSIALLTRSGHKRHASSKGEPSKDWAETSKNTCM